MLFASNMSSYGKWTVEKLKTELNRRGAHTKGRKDLINRLEAYDRNDNFRGELVSMPMQIIPDWPSSGFRQLVPEHRHLLLKLSEGQIEVYLNHRAAVDKLCMSDLKALEKGKLMFESKRIDACSVHISQGDLYFTGIVKAPMKKKVSYNFKLRISRRSGEVINSHCECPAGKGPHGTCKHLAWVLLMLQSFAEGSDAPTVNKTCTENLHNLPQA
ncbi:uncharacterized protein LOC124152775 isoform X1 [Haliotis rufescens]|uniref:uncharacterized protein LOC124152775 isoform X1 n=1 Tax=Haliotis rufescens TaxID=6454 RepID=UPI00201ED103|nr:uncharacterized protein LOC124152775 isoform X1 [Haliotis rufescens]